MHYVITMMIALSGSKHACTDHSRFLSLVQVSTKLLLSARNIQIIRDASGIENLEIIEIVR